MTGWLFDLVERRRLSLVIYVLFLIAGLIALVAILTSISNYTRSVLGRQGLAFEFAEIRIIEGDDPVADLEFRLHNEGTLPIWIESYEFGLYANGERIGGSSSTYRGAGANVDEREYLPDRTIQQNLPAGEQLDVPFTLHIYPSQMEKVREARQDGAVTWLVEAGFLIRLPTAHSNETVGFEDIIEEK